MKQISFYRTWRGLGTALALLLATASAAQAQTLAISGTGGSTTNDVTAFVDRIEIVRTSDNTVVTGAIANAGFETPAQTVGGSTTRPAGGSWTFTGLTGITYAGSGAFGAPATPDGVQVGFVRNSSTSTTGNTISQALTLAAGNYQVRFMTAQRATAPADQGLVITVGGAQVGALTPTTTSSYVSYTSNTFTVNPSGTVSAAPTVTSLNPTSAPVGTSITLTGINLTGATAVSFNGTAATTFTVVNATTITATVPTGATSGPVTVTTPYSPSNGVAFTVVPPTTVTSINRVGSTPTNASSVSYTVTLAAAVTGVSSSNFALATTGLTGASITNVSGTGTTYTVTVSTGTGDGTLGLNLANTTGLSPGVSNVPFAGQVYSIDKTAPTVTITSSTAPNGGYTTTSPLVYVLTFSEDVSAPVVTITNFSGGTITRTSASTFAVSVIPAGPGAVTLTVPANVATDAAGNGNPATNYTIFYNVPTTAPVLTSPANNSTLATSRPTYSGTAPAGSTVTLYLASGGGAPQAIGTTTATGSSFSLMPTAALADGTYAVYATALASGQLVSANSNTSTFTVDATPPTATISTTASSPTNTLPIPFSVSFSEPVTGLSASSFTVSNGTVTSGPTSSGTNAFTFSVTPTGNGTVSVSLAANAVRDAVGNGNTASNAVSVQYTAPIVSGLSVQYQTGDLGQPNDGQLRPFLQLVNNNSTTAVPYSSLTVRYWLTPENFMGQLVTPIDYAKLGTGFVSARYVQLATPRQGAFGYIEYSFAAGAGNLAAGTNSGPIFGKAYKPDYSNFNETDDWSYQTSSSFTTNDHVTLYQNGTLIGGTEPPAVATTTSFRVLAGNQDISTSTSYINVTLQVANAGNRPVNYSDLTVRYYFTRDGATTIVPQVDYAKLGANNISVRYVALTTPLNGADGYLEIGFSSALGVFYPLTNTDNIQFKIRKGDYTAFNQTNDYSFSPSSAVVEQPRIPAYLNGVLVFGTGPSGAVATAQQGSQASAMATSPAETDATATSARLALALTASPNPFGDQLRLQFALPTTQAYTLAVYDGQGRLVQQVASGEAAAGEAQELAVPTQTYAAGFYLVRLTTATGVQHLKLIKQ